MGEAHRKTSPQPASRASQDEERGEFSQPGVGLSTLSHEMKNPLNAIAGFVQLLQSDDTLSARARERVDKIATAAEHLLRVVDERLEEAKAKFGSTARHEEVVELSCLVGEVTSLFEEQARRKGLFLRVRFTDHIPARVFTDALKVRKILINLVGNAIKFTHRGGVVVSVSASHSVNRVCQLEFQVLDTGPGISPSEKEGLFRPFSQGAASSQSDGTGLGLAIGRHDAKVLGGEIDLESTVGLGSVFRLTLPVTWLPDDQTSDGIRESEGDSLPARPSSEEEIRSSGTYRASESVSLAEPARYQDGVDVPKHGD